MGPRLDAQGGGNSHEATWRRGTAAARFHLGNPRGAGGGGGGVSQLCTPAQAPTLLPPDSSKLREDRQPEGCGGGEQRRKGRRSQPPPGPSPGSQPELPGTGGVEVPNFTRSSGMFIYTRLDVFIVIESATVAKSNWRFFPFLAVI